MLGLGLGLGLAVSVLMLSLLAVVGSLLVQTVAPARSLAARRARVVYTFGLVGAFVGLVGARLAEMPTVPTDHFVTFLMTVVFLFMAGAVHSEEYRQAVGRPYRVSR